jgi:hypothetical protein
MFSVILDSMHEKFNRGILQVELLLEILKPVQVYRINIGRDKIARIAKIATQYFENLRFSASGDEATI